MDSIQSQQLNYDLTRGHKKYDYYVKNIEGVLSKLNGILDTTKYEKELQEIINDVNKDPNLSGIKYTEGMQMDYEGFVYKKYNDRLDSLNKKIEKEALPFYELYCLYTNVLKELDQITGENINEIINNTIKIIISINKIDTHNNIEKNNIINKAYNVVYKVILYEEVFNRSDVFDYIKKLNIRTNIENIGRFLSKDLTRLDRNDLIKEDLKNIQDEGLGYDYFDRDIIKKISKITVGNPNAEYQQKKKMVIENLSKKSNELNYKKDKLESSLQDNNSRLYDLKKRKKIIVTKMMSLLLIPIITTSAGYGIGKSMSEKITEYKTITRTVNAKTGQVIGNIELIYDEHPTTYVATVLEASPWRQNKNGAYIRDVNAYEYNSSNENDSYTDINFESKENLRFKYKYVEAKDSLDTTDSMTETTILITETYQDKNDNRKSNKYTLSFTMTGFSIAFFVDLAVLMIRSLGYEEAKRRLARINEDINETNLSNKEINNKLLELKNSMLELEKEYEESSKKYGNLSYSLEYDENPIKKVYTPTLKSDKTRY